MAETAFLDLWLGFGNWILSFLQGAGQKEKAWAALDTLRVNSDVQLSDILRHPWKTQDCVSGALAPFFQNTCLAEL